MKFIVITEENKSEVIEIQEYSDDTGWKNQADVLAELSKEMLSRNMLMITTKAILIES